MTTPEQSRQAVRVVGELLQFLSRETDSYCGLCIARDRMTPVKMPQEIRTEAVCLLRHYPTTDLAIRTINDDRPDKPVTVDELRAVLKAVEEMFPGGYPVLRVGWDGCSLELMCWPCGICGHTDAEFLAAVRAAIEEAKKGKEKRWGSMTTWSVF